MVSLFLFAAVVVVVSTSAGFRAFYKWRSEQPVPTGADEHTDVEVVGMMYSLMGSDEGIA